MVQEVFDTSPPIRSACAEAIFAHAQRLEPDIEAAIARYDVPDLDARSLALHTQAVLQGAFILAKAQGGPGLAAESIAHLRRYILLLFHPHGAPHAN
jgi:TetR/AcrR family transcriptional repressor of nem operon